MMMMKLLFALALLLIPAAASAQCNGIFPNNTVCGNVTGSSNTPRATNPSAFLGAAGGLNGQVQYNNGGALGGLTNTQLTALLNQFTSLLSGVVPASGGGTTNFLRADGTWAPVGPFSVIIYICPSSASAVQKSQCQFIGNGTTDEVAINAASTAAGTTSPSHIVMLPGGYTVANPADLKLAPLSVFDARGTFTNCTSATDCFTINRGQVNTPSNSVWMFGGINFTGPAVAIRSFGQFSDGYISWQKLDGQTKQGIAVYLDSDHTDGGASQSVITLGVGEITNSNFGILLSTNTGSDLIDTVVANTINGYIHNNNKGVFIRSQGSTPINSNTWNLNLDASWNIPSAIAFETNGALDQLNNILASGTNYLFDVGATGNDATKSYPYSVLTAAGSILDSTGNNSNIYPIFSAGGRLTGTAGSLIQFGTIAINATSCGGVTIPAFPNNFLSVQVTMRASSPTASFLAPSAQITDASHFTLCNNYGSTETFMWTGFGN